MTDKDIESKTIPDKATLSKTASVKAAPGKKPEWRHALSTAFKIVFPIGISVWMVMWLMSKVDIEQMRDIVSRECDFWWVAAMMVISVFSHIFRGIRWGIQLRGAGLKRVSVMVESVSIFGAYALNLLFPLLGETWRCLFMAREEGAKVSTVVGTDLGDRFSDAVAILLLFALALALAHDKMVAFLQHYRLGEWLLNIISNPWLWVGIGVLAAICVVGGIAFRDRRFMAGITSTVRNLWRSFAVMFRMKGIPMYLLLTAAIWICYYLETYICFFAFPFTRELITQPGSLWGLVPGLVAFVFGSFSIAIPSNGGLGPWNVAVTYSLTLFGVGYTDGASFSMVVWGFRAATLVVLGLFSAGYIAFEKRRGHIMPESART